MESIAVLVAVIAAMLLALGFCAAGLQLILSLVNPDDRRTAKHDTDIQPTA